jgi:hypothetical protein
VSTGLAANDAAHERSTGATAAESARAFSIGLGAAASAGKLAGGQAGVHVFEPNGSIEVALTEPTFQIGSPTAS